MSRTQVLISVAVALIAVIFFFFFFNQQCQILFFNTMFSISKIKHNYFLRDALPNSGATLSAGALAYEDMLRMTPAPRDEHECRKLLDYQGVLTLPPSTTVVEKVQLRPDLSGFWVIPEGTNDSTSAVILYLHGGAFVSGSLTSHVGFVSELAARTGTRGFLVDYRLSPEHPLPAALDDAVYAYKYLVNTARTCPRQIVVAGDSAGGWLTISTLLALQNPERGRYVPPGAAVTISAWTDLCSSADGRPSFAKNKDKDAMLNKEWLCKQASLATGTTIEEYEKRKSPKISPIYASLTGVKFPPMLMQVGTAEILLDDSVHFAGKADQAGIDVTLEEFEGVQHNTALVFKYVEEAERALASIVEFIKTHV